jgi:hypothetical protein
MVPHKANAWQEMYSLVKASQCVMYWRASLDNVRKGRMPMCAVWSEWKSASVEYYVSAVSADNQTKKTVDRTMSPKY